MVVLSPALFLKCISESLNVFSTRSLRILASLVAVELSCNCVGCTLDSAGLGTRPPNNGIQSDDAVKSHL